MTETVANLLRRAADRLDELDKAAYAPPWRREGFEIVTEIEQEGETFEDAVLKVDGTYGDDAEMDLVVALRPVAAPLAWSLRRTVRLAEIHAEGVVETGPWIDDYLMTHHAPEVAIARAVLGETGGGDPQ